MLNSRTVVSTSSSTATAYPSILRQIVAVFIEHPRAAALRNVHTVAETSINDNEATLSDTSVSDDNVDVVDEQLNKLFRFIEEHDAVRQAITYMCCGCIASFVDIVIFTAFTMLAGIDFLIANVLSMSVGLTISFIFNRSLTFNKRDYTVRRLAKFVVVGTAGFIIQEIVLAVGADTNLESLPAKILALLVAGIFQFLGNKFLTFREMRAAGARAKQ